MTIDGLDVYNAIVDTSGRYENENGFNVWWDYSTGHKAKVGDFVIELVAKFDASSAWKETDEYRYYDGRQGWTGVSYLVFRAIDGEEEAFFKKEGTCDSYGETHWDKGFRRVTATKKTVEVWEYR